jgi:hypothetical protein
VEADFAKRSCLTRYLKQRSIRFEAIAVKADPDKNNTVHCCDIALACAA